MSRIHRFPADLPDEPFQLSARCDKAGTGINRVYFQSQAHGLDFPAMELTLESFGVTIRTKRDKAFAMFIRDVAGTLNLRLNDLIVLRALRAKLQLSVAALCKISQRPESYMDDVLSDLVRRSVIERHGDDFVLSSFVPMLQTADYLGSRRLSRRRETESGESRGNPSRAIDACGYRPSKHACPR